MRELSHTVSTKPTTISNFHVKFDMCSSWTAERWLETRRAAWRPGNNWRPVNTDGPLSRTLLRMLGIWPFVSIVPFKKKSVPHSFSTSPLHLINIFTFLYNQYQYNFQYFSLESKREIEYKQGRSWLYCNIAYSYQFRFNTWFLRDQEI